MNYRIAVCDDEADQAALLKNMVLSWAKQSAYTVDVSLFSSAQAFLFEYENNNPFDILLLDVEMPLPQPNLTSAATKASFSAPDSAASPFTSPAGLLLARKIRESDQRAEIIFITSHFEFISEGYEVDALHYLIKPVAQSKLSSVLSRAAAHLAVEQPAVIINFDGESVKLTEDRILYVESFLHYICIHTTEGDFRIKENISAFEAKLSDAFYRIHRSYIVSLTHITRISRTSVTLADGVVLPLSRGQYDNLNRAFIEHN